MKKIRIIVATWKKNKNKIKIIWILNGFWEKIIYYF